ncbi:MAG: hypothetical protein GY898_34475 [Proteobacteria bacterium]|nr:hypothetical protein [Pseudomonadota bacterium]
MPSLRSWSSAAALALLLGCPKPVPPPPDPAPGEAPIERGLRLSSRSLESLALPRAEEAGYFVPTSSPVIDSVLARPLAAAPFANRLGDALDAAAGPLPDPGTRYRKPELPGIGSPSALLDALTPVAPGGDADPAAPLPPPASTFVSPLPKPSELFESEKGQVLSAHLPADFRDALDELCKHIYKAHLRWGADGQMPTPRRTAESFFVGSFGTELRVRSHPVGVQLGFLELAQRFSYPWMRSHASELLAQIEAILPRLAAAELPASNGPLLYVETSLGALIVGSTGDDKHAGNDAFLLIDPAGNDEYTGGAGSNVGLPSRVGVAIDLGGKDRYTATAPHTQGSGYGGVGILIDAGRDADDYLCTYQCQGAGFLGVGVLWDQGGDDARSANGFAQGAGTLGIGLLVDGSGDDRSVVHGRGQGFASTGGLGAYIDLFGSDQVRLGIPGEDILGLYGGGGQGGAYGTRPYPWVGDATLHGGVGLLYDRHGNDGYYARAYGQGSGEMLALGMLLDRAGSDRYVAEYRSQGSASHLAAGILVDSAGSDAYQGTNTVLGAAVDRSVGVLWDQGDAPDSYRLEPAGNAVPNDLGGGIGWARRAHALGLLVDEGGDDHYVALWDGIAFAVPPARPDRGATALLADLGGSDTYAVSINRPGGNAADNATWLFEDRAAGIDTVVSRAGFDHAPLRPEGGFGPFTWSGEAVPAELPPDPGTGDPEGDPAERWAAAEAEYRARIADSTLAEPLPEWIKIAALSDRDRTVRRAAARALLAAGDPDGVDVLVDSLVWQADDNWDRISWDTVRFQLHLLTDLDPYLTDEQWRVQWRAIRPDVDLPARFAAYAAFERARRASARRELDLLVTECRVAVESDLGTLRRPCATLVGLHAWVLGHPESHVHHDPQRAVELGNLAIVWAPDQPDHFVNLARAWLALEQPELAVRALDKAELLDPDDPGLLALRRVVGEDD